MDDEKSLIFISCGQFSEDERRLGRSIADLIREVLPHAEGYFADLQTTTEGLSTHVMHALSRASAFVCVMHPRGQISRPDGSQITRGSVWIEQEIAIMAFITQVLKRNPPLILYKHPDVGLEGMRQVLLANPTTFTDPAALLGDLRDRLPQMQLDHYADLDLVALVGFDRRKRESNGSRHVYDLTVDVKNVGRQMVREFDLRVFFPRDFVAPGATYDHALSTESHLCFRADGRRAPHGLYAGDTLQNPLQIEYVVTDKLFENREAMNSTFTVEIRSGARSPKREVHRIRDFNEF